MVAIERNKAFYLVIISDCCSKIVLHKKIRSDQIWKKKLLIHQTNQLYVHLWKHSPPAGDRCMQDLHKYSNCLLIMQELSHNMQLPRCTSWYKWDQICIKPHLKNAQRHISLYIFIIYCQEIKWSHSLKKRAPNVGYDHLATKTGIIKWHTLKSGTTHNAQKN